MSKTRGAPVGLTILWWKAHALGRSVAQSPDPPTSLRKTNLAKLAALHRCLTPKA